MRLRIFVFVATSLLGFVSCQTAEKKPQADMPTPASSVATDSIEPAIVTDTVKHDSDDPAIWIHPTDPAQSLIVATDKDEDGALYVFNLQGKIIGDKVVRGIRRPNNVDIEYGLMLKGKATDIAVATERNAKRLRIFSLPDMKAIDGGGIPVFEGDTAKDARDVMGVGLYKRAKDGAIFAIVSRKTGPTNNFLYQYRLSDRGDGNVKAELVRKFGNFSGKKEIEAILVDDAMGYVYYSDETVGVRKYYADPQASGEELAFFGTTGFKDDHEGISLYALTDSTGYILVSDQQANCFRIFPREGSPGKPHDHQLLKIVYTKTLESDGSELCSLPLGAFSKGLLVAMSEGKTFHYYRWEDIAGKDLKSR